MTILNTLAESTADDLQGYVRDALTRNSTGTGPVMVDAAFDAPNLSWAKSLGFDSMSDLLLISAAHAIGFAVAVMAVSVGASETIALPSIYAGLKGIPSKRKIAFAEDGLFQSDLCVLHGLFRAQGHDLFLPSAICPAFTPKNKSQRKPMILATSESNAQNKDYEAVLQSALSGMGLTKGTYAVMCVATVNNVISLDKADYAYVSRLRFYAKPLSTANLVPLGSDASVQQRIAKQVALLERLKAQTGFGETAFPEVITSSPVAEVPKEESIELDPECKDRFSVTSKDFFDSSEDLASADLQAAAEIL